MGAAILRTERRSGIKKGSVCGGAAIFSRFTVACCGPCRICSPAARAGQSWVGLSCAHPGGADFGEGGRSPGGVGAAWQGGMGVAWGGPAPSRLDNAPEPPDRRAPTPS